MSNSSIVARLRTAGQDYEYGRISVSAFADELRGSSTALEGVEYGRVKEAQLVYGQLLQAVEAGRENDVDRQALGAWLNGWLATVPVVAA